VVGTASGIGRFFKVFYSILELEVHGTSGVKMTLRILVVAPLFQEWYAGRFILSAARSEGLEALGFDYRFPFNLKDFYIHNRGVDELWGIVRRKVKIVQNAFLTIINERLVKVSEKYCPDLVLVCEGELLKEDTLERIRKVVGSKLAFWTFDDPQLIERHLKVARWYDNCFTNSLDAVLTYQENDIDSVSYLPWGCDPHIHRRINLDDLKDAKYKSAVCLYANFNTKRVAFLRRVSDIQLGIWGRGWNLLHHGDPLRNFWKGPIVRLMELVKMYSGTKIALNIQRPETTLSTTTSRIWEATSCGAMLLTENVSGIDLAFEVGKEVVCYEGAKDLGEKVIFYLTNEEMRREIASCGQARSRRCHTVANRLRKILEFCKP
jgi:spore maturation protein CgeB